MKQGPTQRGLTFGSDGFLYVVDDYSDSVLKVDPATGAATVFVDEVTLLALSGITSVNLGSSIVGDEGGTIYVGSDGTPDAIFAIDTAGSASLLSADPIFSDLDVFMTRAQNGDLIISDNSNADTIYRVTTLGVVSVFLSETSLENVVSQDVDLEGGIAFDSLGEFYVAEESSDNILKFDNNLVGSIWISEAEIMAVTLSTGADFEGGIAFAPGTPIPTINQWGMIVLLLLMAGASLWFMRRKQINKHLD